MTLPIVSDKWGIAKKLLVAFHELLHDQYIQDYKGEMTDIPSATSFIEQLSLNLVTQWLLLLKQLYVPDTCLDGGIVANVFGRLKWCQLIGISANVTKPSLRSELR